MIKFSKEKVLLLHQLIAEETGGSIGVRDEALLESALENAFSSFDGQEFYPSKEEKGARLGYTLISNHAFVDGNKRIGMYVMLTFLEVNSGSYPIAPLATASPTSTISSLVHSNLMPLTSKKVSMTYIPIRLFPSTKA